jgi:hypothetical protein
VLIQRRFDKAECLIVGHSGRPEAEPGSHDQARRRTT